MLETLKRNIIYGTTYMAVEHLGSNTDAEIHCVTVQLKKGELEIRDSETLNNIEDFKQFANTPKHIHLVINNDQVLTRTIVSSSSNILSLVNEAFQGITLDDFYYDAIQLENQSLISICRKSYIDELIGLYDAIGIKVTSWSLGITPMAFYEGILSGDFALPAQDRSLLYVDGLLTSIDDPLETASNSYTIEGDEVPAKYLNALGAIFGLFRSNDRVKSNSDEAIAIEKDNFKQHRLYALGLPLAVGILLVIFLANFFMYNHYFTKVEELEAIGNTNLVQRDLLLRKDSLVDKKQRLFEDVIASSSSSSSYFLDKVAQQMPTSILLDRLVYHPLEKKMKPNKPLQVATNTIEIAGATRETNDLSIWIKHIENLDFVKNVSIKQLDQKRSLSNFNITLSIGK